MYKKQLTAEKIICLIALIVSVAVFVYSLGIMTDLYDALYSTMRNANDLTKTDVPGSIVYYNMQEFNQYFLKGSIIQVLLALFLRITNTHVRRKYYIGNYVATAAYAVYAAAFAFWCHGYIEIFKQQFLKVDFAALKEHAEMWNTYYTESTFWFDIHYLIFGISICSAILLVANAVWKMQLMKEEKALLSTGREAKA